VFMVERDGRYVDSLSSGWNWEVDGRENHCDGVYDCEVYSEIRVLSEMRVDN
jgi:hypothetical protein